MSRKILEGKINGSRPVWKAKDKWTEAATRVDRKLLGSGRRKRLASDGKIWGRKVEEASYRNCDVMYMMMITIIIIIIIKETMILLLLLLLVVVVVVVVVVVARVYSLLLKIILHVIKLFFPFFILPIPGIEFKFPHFQPTTAHSCDLIPKIFLKTLNSYMFRTLLFHHHAI
jgi:hypothetical protein